MIHPMADNGTMVELAGVTKAKAPVYGMTAPFFCTSPVKRRGLAPPKETFVVWVLTCKVKT